MNRTATIRARIEPDLKNEVEKILMNLGLTGSDAINLLYRQIRLRKGVPFELTLRPHLDLSNATIEEIEERYAARIPNRETLEALREPVKKMKSYRNSKELFAELGV